MKGQAPAAGRLRERVSAALVLGVADPDVVERYRAKIVEVAGSDCWWWTGAISGRGHGRKRAILRQMQHSVAHRGQLALIAVSHCGAHLERES